jgi:hypothetical protein
VSDVADTVALFRRAVELLAGIDDPAATAAAAAIDLCLAGVDFDSAAGLTFGWRRQMREQSRDRALKALVKLHPNMDESVLAGRIAKGVKRAMRIHGSRPDGEAGYFWDLLQAQVTLGPKQWGRLIVQIRGHCKSAMSGTVQQDPSPED